MPTRKTFAAVDLGSNSFHLLVARDEDGHLTFLDRLRDTVRMAAGLDAQRLLTAEAEERALACLAQFGQRLTALPSANVRAVGTNTLRKMRNAEDFLAKARQALGHPIDIIAGPEEARLIYLGVAHDQAPARGHQLVVDIGGGSTEAIIGHGFEPIVVDSLYMGCVSYSEEFFPGGVVTREAFRRADTAARLELRPIAREYRERGWELALGASGTIKSIGKILQEQGWADGGITRAGLKQLRAALIEAGDTAQVKLAGLADERRPVLAGGVAVLYSVFKALKIERMLVSQGALREGLLYDLIGRTRHEDVRERTVEKMCRRYEVDRLHADRVALTALRLFRDVKDAWGLDDPADADALRWAARLHEIGLAVAHAQYHRHGAYLLTYADLPGFGRHEQRLLAALVRNHRRKLAAGSFQDLPRESGRRALHLGLLLRLAVLLHRSRSHAPLPAIALRAEDRCLELRFPEGWFEEHPLSRADLEQERAYLRAVDIELRLA